MKTEQDINLERNFMFTIVGITGRVGGSTAGALLAAEKKVRGLVRDKARAAHWAKQGVDLVPGNVDDIAALTEALRGSEGVFVMVPPYFAPAPGYPETKSIVAKIRSALAAAKPNKVVYLSSVGAQHRHGLGLITQSHILEEEMRTLPSANAFIRPAWFLENYQWDVQPARERGEIDLYLTPDRSISMVATQDIGELAAKTLQQEWKSNRVLELEGPEKYSPAAAAVAFSKLLGHPVTGHPIPRSEWHRLFVQQGTAEDRTAPRIEMLDGFNSGWIDFAGDGTERFKGKVTLEEVIKGLIAKNSVPE
ncbi:MAG TPA: NmrA family NAD(P)-binding protein [Verrucomicrobiae bacterium]|nr:NmrA family NAD(P)-binding protein [Verrucomicrobiae bacterium]